jgi:hypothetical protein
MPIDDLSRAGARGRGATTATGPAPRAAERRHALGYQDAAMPDGGLAAWEAAAGYRVDSGVHVPSRALAEVVVEHEARARPTGLRRN